MKKITFEQLKRIVKKSLVKERRERYEREEKPVSRRDVPEKLASLLEDEYEATIHNDGSYPYLYVTIPLNSENSRGGTRLRNTVMARLEREVRRTGWYIIDTFEAFDDCPDFTILISPYASPHEPMSDYLDRTILRQRQQDADNAARYITMGRDRVKESTKVTLTLKQLRSLLH